jgi:hypothetical protein
VGYAWATNFTRSPANVRKYLRTHKRKNLDDRRVCAHVCKRVPMPEDADQVKVANLIQPILDIGGVRDRAHNAWSTFATKAS